jgi:hypothetical protein
VDDIFSTDNGDPYKGFNRASVIFGSRKAVEPTLRPQDLLTPGGFGNARLAGACAVMALSMALLYVWPILFFVNFWVPLDGQTYIGALVAAMLGFFLFLYFAAARETRRDRELAARL